MTSAACSTSIPTDFVDDFQPDNPFQNTRSIEFFHSRYGQTTDILNLMQGSEQEQKDYIKGVFYSSTTILVIVIVWMLLLLLFKSMGSYQVGILSGNQVPVVLKEKKNNGDDDDDGEEEEESFDERYQDAKKRLKFYRMIVVFAGMSIVISSILMSVNGIDSLTNSLNDGRDSISIVSNLTDRGIDIIDRLLIQNDDAAILVEDFLENINGICPNVRDPLCEDLDDITTCNFDGIFDTATVTAVVQHFRNSERSTIYKELLKARKDLIKLNQVANDVDDQASQFHWALYLAMGFSLCLAAMSLFMIVFGILLPPQHKKMMPRAVQCLRSWIVMPTFILFVVLSFVFCLTFIFGSIVLADMCVDSPDAKIQVLLDRYQQESQVDSELTPILIDFVNFYINQCPEDQLPQEITDQVIYFRDAISLVSDFTGALAQSSSGLEVICGFEEPKTVTTLARSTNENLCDVAAITVTIRQYFQCENWYPLYETTVYDAMCYNGTEGFAWVAGTQFVVVFMAMIVLTLRGAFYDVEVIDENEKNSNEDSESTKSLERTSTLHTERTMSPRPPSSASSSRRVVTVSPSQDGGFELFPQHHQGSEF